MRKVYCALLLAVLVISCSAAGMTWKRIRLTDAGTISIPQHWNVLAQDSSVIENAYGKGVSCRTLLSTQASDALMAVLLYWPYSGDSAQKFASDIAESLMLRYGSKSRPTNSEMKIGVIRASTVTYRIDSENDQKVTAFTHRGKTFCLVITYRHSDEYRVSRLTRGILSRWQL
ncbi:MAG: hypothetical protein IKQ95_06760 [Synergistaceae bacterium]|nr:hypothetical protein [Synergistaceae bacterium]